LKQKITQEQARELSERQMDNIYKWWDKSLVKEEFVEFILTLPAIDFFNEIPKQEKCLPNLIAIKEMFPLISIGQCIDLIFAITKVVPEYQYEPAEGFYVSLYGYLGKDRTYPPKPELIDALWQVVGEITK